ncbi:SUMF1/EgtB/PvdO family nonheme iron enzyme [Calothrix sp. CCY 0018]|uniref:SUMF1/EgtB/PvdO family nonheme iron enzyme n=1 Tax=Calothrix sp. CCY 0018 TaxID=3103864 RepID=UPI0039C6CBB7
MGQNWAITIGINNYDNLSPLKYARRDAEVMQHWFEQAGFDEVFLFTENSPKIPANPPIATQPTHARFLRFLNVQFENTLLQPEDNLWFFFAGHGTRFKDQDYLMFLDSDPQAVDRTAILVDYVVQRLRRCGAGNVVLLLDACRDEGSRGGLGIGEEHKGVITFYSCTANQKSWEIDELQHGAFTHTLLEGLRLSGESNCATVERLDQYLRYNVPKINSRYGKEPQNPYLEADPPNKIHWILLEQAATLKDVEPLRYQASSAENKGDLELAKQLWVRVLAASRADWDAIEAIGRIAVRQAQSPIYPSPQLDIAISEPVTSSRGDTTPENPSPNLSPARGEALNSPHPLNSPPSLAGKGAGGLGSFQFEVITVNIQGEEINREKRQAEYFSEDLGDGVNLDMVYIPAGKFMMGSPEGEGYDDEKPQHEVTVPEFFMGKYPVTQAQWEVVAALPGIKRNLEAKPSNFKGSNLPVESVSWHDAVEFCARLSKYTDKQYRLPSEAEWEYACRAGTTTPFHFGETITDKFANYNARKNFANEPLGKHLQKTTAVGQFPPNTFGLYDMHGNVWEWCLDNWHNNYDKAPTDGSTWINNNNRDRKVVRGGSWDYKSDFCRSANRDNNPPGFNINPVGLRVVCGGSSSIFSP